MGVVSLFIRHEQFGLAFDVCQFKWDSRRFALESPLGNLQWPTTHAEAARLSWMKANKSALIVSASVVGMPCGKPL